MKTEYKEIITMQGEKASTFTIVTRKGDCSGIFVKEENRIFVHHIQAKHGMKGLMEILINKYKTNLITFTPLINNQIINKVKGEIKIMKAEDIRNPYKEDFQYMECIWKK